MSLSWRRHDRWPHSLHGRVALVLVGTVGLAQAAGLGVHAWAAPLLGHWAWPGPRILLAFPAITAVAAGLAFLAIQRLTAPITQFARQADRLSRDIQAPLLPEDGPSELARASAALNLLAIRARRVAADRGHMLTALAHDLRTPVTRLRLRTEFVDDDETRSLLLADLDQVERRIEEALALARDQRDAPPAMVDLAVLVRTVLDELAEEQPELGARLTFVGPERLVVRARPAAIKRALGNLIGNAVAYGGTATVTLSGPRGLGKGERFASVTVEDDGPGIPHAEMARMFEPFQRGEASRNRETGGSGLGLPIARDILRAHGGDVTLVNRHGGGLRATASLPVG